MLTGNQCKFPFGCQCAGAGEPVQDDVEKLIYMARFQLLVATLKIGGEHSNETRLHTLDISVPGSMTCGSGCRCMSDDVSPPPTSSIHTVGDVSFSQHPRA